jgi:dTDP-4-amino-4,6-dideoxygalactose transaminase
MIPFNKPYMTGKELTYIAESHANCKLAGDGPFTDKCHLWLEEYTGCKSALLTHSCTAALEMSALLLDISSGDEVIMPSYTFVSTANAFVIRGAVPVFVDIRPDTLNLDEKLLESAITAKTKAIVPVHYAGVSCDMDVINDIAKKYGIAVVEDAAQGISSTYKGQALGTIGTLGAYSFHETKNLISGEGGALLINQDQLLLMAEMIREKGTDRSRFFRGEVDKYTWREKGSSFLPGELTAAFLWAQLENSKFIQDSRMVSWLKYHYLLGAAEENKLIIRPTIPDYCQHNAHMYYVILAEKFERNYVLKALLERGINAVFHYVPLHSSPAGKKFGRVATKMSVTNSRSKQLIRLPLWVGLEDEQQNYIVKTLVNILEELN